MEIRNYNKGDEKKILELFEVVFKQKLSLENWEWRFRDNPAGQYMIKLMWEKDKLIGHYAVSPVIMSVEGEDVLTAHSLTTMTHPDYGGRGVFKELSNAMYNELENKRGCKAIWGFPNNNSHYGFVKRLEWINLAVLHTLGIAPKHLKPSNINYKFKQITEFERHHQSFITEKNTKFAKILTKKNTAYLNWRFVQKPNSPYRCYEFNTESNRAILIVKPYLLNKQNTYDLNIIDCFMDNYEDLSDFILHIIKELKLNFERVSIWKNIFSPEHLDLERQGFVPVLPQTYLAARIHESMPNRFNDYRNWSISMSDSDVF